MRLRMAAPALALLATACSDPRPFEPGWERSGLTWTKDVGPLLAASCGGCHAGAQAQGGFDATSYLGAIGAGGPTRFAVAGDASSRILAVLDPARADRSHRGFEAVHDTLRTWVVDDALAYFDSPIHPKGWLDPQNADFHGKTLAQMQLDTSSCRHCHGEDFAGGKAGFSCLGCHKDGLAPGATDNCTSCHGQPPPTGAHLTHVNGGDLQHKLECGDCHLVPQVWDAKNGHLLTTGGQPDPGVQVPFGDFAKQRPAFATSPNPAAPAYDARSHTCSGVYCHGGGFTDAAAKNTTPDWTKAGQGEAACGNCHGLPPSNHAVDRCELCHPRVVDANRQLVSLTLHLDGNLDLGKDGQGNCWSCHGSQPNGAPAPDLSGSNSSDSPGVGAHLSHLTGLHRLRGPLACADCHVDVKDVHTPGHIDHALPAQVFPAGTSALAYTDGATPAFDPQAASCSAVYCHGGGQKLAADGSYTKRATWTWTTPGSEGQLTCGSCHGLPPTTQGHDASMTLKDCATCHAKTVDAKGDILFAPDGSSTHINGVVDD